jgi:hypothetical protein
VIRLAACAPESDWARHRARRTELEALDRSFAESAGRVGELGSLGF